MWMVEQAVGADIFVDFRKSEFGFCAATTGAADATFRVDDDRGTGLIEAGFQQRCQREKRGGGITTRICDARGAFDFFRKDIRKTVGPTARVTMIPTDVQHARRSIDAAKGLFRLTCGKRREKELELGELLRVPLFDGEIAKLA